MLVIYRERKIIRKISFKNFSFLRKIKLALQYIYICTAPAIVQTLIPCYGAEGMDSVPKYSTCYGYDSRGIQLPCYWKDSLVMHLPISVKFDHVHKIKSKSQIHFKQNGHD